MVNPKKRSIFATEILNNSFDMNKRNNHAKIIALYRAGVINENTPERLVNSLIDGCAKQANACCPLRKKHMYNVGDRFMRPWTGTNSILTIIGVDLKNREYICHSSLFTSGERNTTIRVSFSDDCRLLPMGCCSCCQCCKPKFHVGDVIKRVGTYYDIVRHRYEDLPHLEILDVDCINRKYVVRNTSMKSYHFEVSMDEDFTLVSSACPVSCCNRMAFCDLCNRPIFGVGDRIKWSYDKDSAVLVVDDIDLCGKRYCVHNGDYRFTISFENNDLLTFVSSACPVSCCNPCYCCKCRCCNR